MRRTAIGRALVWWEIPKILRFLSAETGRALTLLFYIDHIMAAIRQFVEVQLQRWLKDLAGQAPGSKVANKDERACIDVAFFPNRRTSDSASSFISTRLFLIAGRACDYRTPAV